MINIRETPVELREGLENHWRHNPEGPIWWGVEKLSEDKYIIREYEDGVSLWMIPEWEVSSLEAAKTRIAMLKLSRILD